MFFVPQSAVFITVNYAVGQHKGIQVNLLKGMFRAAREKIEFKSSRVSVGSDMAQGMY